MAALLAEIVTFFEELVAETNMACLIRMNLKSKRVLYLTHLLSGLKDLLPSKECPKLYLQPVKQFDKKGFLEGCFDSLVENRFL